MILKFACLNLRVTNVMAKDKILSIVLSRKIFQNIDTSTMQYGTHHSNPPRSNLSQCTYKNIANNPIQLSNHFNLPRDAQKFMLYFCLSLALVVLLPHVTHINSLKKNQFSCCCLSKRILLAHYVRVDVIYGCNTAYYHTILQSWWLARVQVS